MNETLCGKSCEQCDWREPHQCPGCQAGPGNVHTGQCEIAKCCREKGHTTCETCGFQANCQLLRGKDAEPEQRQRDMEAQAARARWHAEQAPVLGKWLWIRFWLIIPSMLSAVLTNIDRIAWAGDVLNMLTAFVAAWVLWQLRNVADRYRIAAICGFVLAAITIPVNWITGQQLSGDGRALLLLALLPLGGVSLYATYQQYMAHADVLTGLDGVLAGKWRSLWMWEIGFLLGMIGCIILAFISGILGALALIACAVGLVVVSILGIVYLYRTAQLFRNFVEERGALPDEAAL